MPLVTAFNLRADDRLPEIEEAVRLALTSMPELGSTTSRSIWFPCLRQKASTER